MALPADPAPTSGTGVARANVDMPINSSAKPTAFCIDLRYFEGVVKPHLRFLSEYSVGVLLSSKISTFGICRSLQKGYLREIQWVLLVR